LNPEIPQRDALRDTRRHKLPFFLSLGGDTLSKAFAADDLRRAKSGCEQTKGGIEWFVVLMVVVVVVMFWFWFLVLMWRDVKGQPGLCLGWRRAVCSG